MTEKYVYHASNNKNIEILEPRAQSVRDPEEGPVIFASLDKTYVTCFLVPTNDSWVKISQYSSDRHDTIYVICISDEKRFRELDKGGAIYSLPSASFYLDKSKGDLEWTSRESVRPVKKELYISGLDAMIDNGVIVYFCDKSTLLDLKKDPSDVAHAMGVFKSLVSENEKRCLANPIHEYYQRT